MPTTTKFRTFLLPGIGIAVIALLLVDRVRINTRNERAQVEAKEDALRRQMAVVYHNEATLIAGVYKKLREDADTVDVALFVESSDLLNALWKHEKEIDQAQYERATITSKRILDALGCEDLDAFLNFVRNKMKVIAAKNGQQEPTQEEMVIGFLGFDSLEEFDQFQAFISRACTESVFYGDDIESRIKNAPDSKFRLF